MPNDEINRQEIERGYQESGFETRHVGDGPGAVYQPERYEKVRLFTLRGSAEIKLDDEPWKTVEAGQELVMDDAQMHEARVGKDGWEHIVAASAEELKRLGLYKQ
jgi:hypothetical protein